MSSPILALIPEHVVLEVNKGCSALFEQKCCSNIIYNLNLSANCLELFFIKLLGYSIIVFGSIVKLPQVLKIFRAKSGVGISSIGVLLELMAITFNSSYSFRNNFPLSTWGECIFLAIETASIAFMVFWFDQQRLKALSFLLTYLAAVYVLIYSTLISMDFIWLLQSTVVFLAVGGKLMQAYKNYKAQHTGQLSALSAWAIFGGSCVRVLTTVRETGDVLTTMTFICSSLANAAIAAQVWWYWQSTQKFIEKAKEQKDK